MNRQGFRRRGSGAGDPAAPGGLRSGGEEGVTLVEIAVVVGVVGLLAMLSYPSFQGWREAGELRNAAVELADAMQAARTRSIVERRNHTVRVDFGQDTYSVTPAGGSALPRLGAAWTTVDLYRDDGDPECPSLSGQDVVFLPNNSADAAGFEAVYLKSRSLLVRIRYRVKVLGATAKIGVERWSGGEWVGSF